MRPIDLRSDTVTRPTEQMRQAMARAEVGDDVYGDDPTVNELEAYAAEVVGKEASLVQHEAGAAAIIAGVQLRTFVPRGAFPVWEDIREHIRSGDDIHWPNTDLIALENALGNGEVLPVDVLEETANQARTLGIPIHLDGARLFNAAHFSGVEAKRIALADSVMFCLSKGLCSPIGSMVAGSRDFIREARKRRKIMGGGMRQAGVIAACGLVSLRTMIHRLPEDREKAERLAAVFRRSGLFEMNPEPVKINMFFLRYRDQGDGNREQRLAEQLIKAGVKINPPDNGWIRIVTHNDVSEEDISRACKLIEAVVAAVG
jgi:threonine aldolase